jgi:hypothetical protein
MAQTAAGRQLTEAHRGQQLAVRAGTYENLLRLWAIVDPRDLSGTIDTFVRAAVILAGRDYDRSSGVAARYFNLFRRLEGVPGTASAALAPAPTAEQMSDQIRGATIASIVRARRAGLTVEGAKRRALTTVLGTVGKLVLNGGRMTIIGSVARDRQALGWGRVTSGDPCAFCRMLASRGPTYRSERAADFHPHDSCGCSAEVIYRGDGASAQATAYAREWQASQAAARRDGTASSGTANDALNNYRRYLSGGSETTAPAPETDGSPPA